MTQFTSIHCPHCGASNPGGGAFCESCGKALPPPVPTGPRIVGNETLATTGAGQELQDEQLHKQAKRASGALLAVAILTTIAGLVIFALSRSAPSGTMASRGIEISSAVGVVTLIIAAVFWGLYIWSRSQPLPAAIVGLVVYGTLVTINVILHISAAGQEGGPRGLGIGCLDIIIIVVLAQAITAGAQHRKLMRQQGYPR
jgi:hypothetical protein